MSTTNGGGGSHPTRTWLITLLRSTGGIMITTLPPQYLLSLARYSALECNIKCDSSSRVNTHNSTFSVMSGSFLLHYRKLSEIHHHHRTFEDFKWLDQKYYWYWSFKYDLSANHKRDVRRIEMRCYKNWNIYIKRSGSIHHTAPSAAVCVLPTLRSRMRSHYRARVSSAGTNQATMETMNLTDTRLVLLVLPDNTFYNPLSHQATKLPSSQHASQMSLSSHPWGLQNTLTKHGLI